MSTATVESLRPEKTLPDSIEAVDTLLLREGIPVIERVKLIALRHDLYRAKFSAKQKDFVRHTASALKLSTRPIETWIRILRTVPPELLDLAETIEPPMLTSDVYALCEHPHAKQREAIEAVINGLAGSVREALGTVESRPASEKNMAQVQDLHDQGLHTRDIASATGLAPKTVIRIKTSLGVTQKSKLWEDIDHVASALEGVSIRIDALIQQLETSEEVAPKKEINQCSKSLGRTARTIHRLRNALKQRCSQ